MSDGFIFNHNFCVNCKACSAACILENKWTIRPRDIFTFNNESIPVSPLINLSLACNHCEIAVCMEGCPASAYTRDNLTGAIIVDSTKCIGCRYCQWNCPYDAPKYDPAERTIVKCNLCYTRVASGEKPACTLACPTGALRYDTLSDQNNNNTYPWFPDKKLRPAIELVSDNSGELLKIVPERNYLSIVHRKKYKNITTDVPLIIFSFLSTLSVAGIVSSFINGKYPGVAWLIPLMLAALSSLFHLGNKWRTWRAMSNPVNSPLSREIAAFIIFSLLAFLTAILNNPGLLIASSLTGIVFLILIDGVYIYPDKSKTVILHSGQTFLSSLLIISFFTGSLPAFIFTAILKMAFSVNLLINKHSCFSLRFFRIAFLLITGISLVLNGQPNDLVVSFVFLSGEFIDRVLFYIDFNPMSIKKLINEQLNIE